jgi:hypothetical protein
VTKEELIKALKQLPDGAVIVQANSAEGALHYLTGPIELGWWEQSEGYGDFYDKAQAEDPEYEWEPGENSAVAICFFPEE